MFPTVMNCLIILMYTNLNNLSYFFVTANILSIFKDDIQRFWFLFSGSLFFWKIDLGFLNSAAEEQIDEKEREKH